MVSSLGLSGAPVDLMNLGINAVKAGYGYAGHKMGLLSASDMPEIDEKPVGGSEWIAEQMQKRSLLGNYRNPTAEILAGGLLAPLAGAAVQARAPQIAAGLLKAQENLAAPSTIPQRGQRGTIVYHGSPHKVRQVRLVKDRHGRGRAGLRAWAVFWRSRLVLRSPMQRSCRKERQWIRLGADKGCLSF